VISLVSSAINMTLLAFAAERRAAAPLLLGAGAIDVSCSRGAQQQTRRTPQRQSNDTTDRRTDRRATVT